MTTHKFVAVLNKKVDPGVVMNALAHMSLGVVATATPEELSNMGFIDFTDKDGDIHKSISKNSYVILRADNSNQIRTLRNAAKEKGIHFIDFTSSMTGDTYVEQLEKTKNTPEVELEYYGIVMFAPKHEFEELTGKFSLWR
jgi:hypothetical protein